MGIEAESEPVSCLFPRSQSGNRRLVHSVYILGRQESLPKIRMYTQNVYTKKTSSLVLLSLLLLSALLIAIPASPVHAIVSGSPYLGVVNAVPTPASAAFGAVFVTGNAGSSIAKTDGSVVGQLSIFFSGTGITSVVFSGAQYYLYLSKDGLAQLSAGDIRYAGPFLTSDLTTFVGTLHANPEANGTYYDGQVSGLAAPCAVVCKLITGPLPTQISAGYMFIKVWDGSAVAAAQYININAGITVSPASVVANEPVTVQGGGFAPSTLIDLTYAYVFHPWSGHKMVVSGYW